MIMPPPDTIYPCDPPHTAGAIKAWVVAELSRAINVDPATIDTSAPLYTLGADSLTAIGLTGALSAWLKRDLPATLMWDYGSINDLCEGLAQPDAALKAHTRPGIVNLQPHGDRLPLFCFPGVGGHPAIFSALAAQLRPDVPCYGLVVPGLNGEQTPLTRVEDIAAAMLGSIRLLQPAGPYQFAGYSFGGFLAYEAAQQLAAIGEKVSLLAIYDTFTAAGRVFRPMWERVLLHAWLSATRTNHRRHLFHRLKRLAHRKAGAVNVKPAPQRCLSLADQRGEAVWLTDNQAAANYRPLPYSGSILLFRATERSIDSPFYRFDESNGWRALAAGGGVRVIDLPGTHENILYVEHAPTAAAKLRPFLSDELMR